MTYSKLFHSYFRAGNDVERDKQRPTDRLMLDGLKAFFDYVKDLDRRRIDFKDCWRTYTSPCSVNDRDTAGVFAPYDPNNNLMEDADDMFYKIMKDAANRPRNLLNQAASYECNPRKTVVNIFECYPRVCKALALNNVCIDFICGEEDHVAETRFPTIVYNTKFQQQDKEVKTQGATNAKSKILRNI